MITYTRQQDEVILQMPIEDWERLLLLTGMGIGAVKQVSTERTFWRWIKFINELNRTNPDYTPYEIPEAFQ